MLGGSFACVAAGQKKKKKVIISAAKLQPGGGNQLPSSSSRSGRTGSRAAQFSDKVERDQQTGGRSLSLGNFQKKEKKKALEARRTAGKRTRNTAGKFKEEKGAYFHPKSGYLKRAAGIVWLRVRWLRAFHSFHSGANDGASRRVASHRIASHRAAPLTPSPASDPLGWLAGAGGDGGGGSYLDPGFVGGKLNVCFNAVDRHVENGRGGHPAIIYDSPVARMKQIITYAEVQEQVSKLAGVLVKHGVKTGDLVVIYMPMIPQAIFAMLACARIGAPHSLIFGGFASRELSVRIDHAKPKMIVTASFGIEPGRRVEYIPLVQKALEMSTHKPQKVLIYNRPGMEKAWLDSDKSLEWEEEIATAHPHDCVPVPANHPLYILYTSGTTGTPKGVVRDTGGCAVMLNWTMSNVYDLRPGEVWWAASDLGWVVGHSYICYGPLIYGITTVLYEGKPVGTPDAGAYFRILSEHGVASMFISPTAIRAIRQQDPEASLGKQYPLTKTRVLFVAGERCDIETLEWAKKNFRVPVLDHWWQTETGSSITASCVGLGNSLSPPAGQAGKPVPGYNVKVLDDDMREAKPRTLGNIVVRLPLPPGTALSLWQNDQLFRELYFSKFPGYYDTMDAGYVDEDGFLYIMSRSDDVINVAGHRLSTGALEEAVLQHPAVVDCAVVGLEDSLKGHVPLALCVLKNGWKKSQKDVADEVVKVVRANIGPVAALRTVLFVKALPKTRSGKTPRSTLSNLINRKPYKISPTIEDPSVFKDIEETVREKM